METETFEIKVRRHPIYAVVFGLIGIGGAVAGWYYTQYGVIFVGGLCLVLAVSLFLFPALVISKEAVELRNLFGFTGRVIPHDGLGKLSVREGRLVIVYAQRRAELPRPNARGLHPADWKFMAKALQEAASHEKNVRR